MSANPVVPDNLQSFRSDLEKLPDNLMVQKYITFGESHVLTPEQYFLLKHEISEEFDLHPSQVVIVGSGKLGFSIAPHKRYTVFGDESDVDVALVSDILFDTLWTVVFEYKNNGGYWPGEQKFKNYLFQGWLRPDQLPPDVSIKRRWFEFFRQLTESQSFGPYEIRAGLYKSWWHLERYQQRAVARCRDNS